MSAKRLLLLVAGIILAIIILLWARSRPRDYVNFPPTAHGPWVAVGDSLTEGIGASDGINYPALLSQHLGIAITNFGRSGETTAGGLTRASQVADLRPRVVLLCL